MTLFERRLAEKMKDPEFREGYEEASREIEEHCIVFNWHGDAPNKGTGDLFAEEALEALIEIAERHGCHVGGGFQVAHSPCDDCAKLAALEARPRKDTREMTDDDLAAIKQRAKAATPGPWTAWPSGKVTSELTDDGEKYDEEIAIVADGWSIRQGLDGADADFIARARTDVPRLIAEIERLRAMPTRDAIERAIAETACGEPPGTWAECAAAILALIADVRGSQRS